MKEMNKKLQKNVIKSAQNFVFICVFAKPKIKSKTLNEFVLLLFILLFSNRHISAYVLLITKR